MVVAWGPEFRFFYNDRYRPILGSTKHPARRGPARGRDLSRGLGRHRPRVRARAPRRVVRDRRLAAAARPQRVPRELLVHALLQPHPGRERWRGRPAGRGGGDDGPRGRGAAAGHAARPRPAGRGCHDRRRRRAPMPPRCSSRTRRTSRSLSSTCWSPMAARLAAWPGPAFPRTIRPAAETVELGAGEDDAHVAAGPGRSRAGDGGPRGPAGALRAAARRLLSGRARTPAVLLPLVRPGQERPYGVLVAGRQPPPGARRPRTADSSSWPPTTSPPRSATRTPSRRRAAAPRRLPRSTAPRPRSSATSATSSARRSPFCSGPTEDALASPDQALRGEALEIRPSQRAPPPQARERAARFLAPRSGPGGGAVRAGRSAARSRGTWPAASGRRSSARA